MTKPTIKAIEYYPPESDAKSGVIWDFGRIEVHMIHIDGRVMRATVPLDPFAKPAETIDKVRIALGIASTAIDGDTND